MITVRYHIYNNFCSWAKSQIYSDYNDHNDLRCTAI